MKFDIIIDKQRRVKWGDKQWKLIKLKIFFKRII